MTNPLPPPCSSWNCRSEEELTRKAWLRLERLQATPPLSVHWHQQMTLMGIWTTWTRTFSKSFDEPIEIVNHIWLRRTWWMGPATQLLTHFTYCNCALVALPCKALTRTRVSCSSLAVPTTSRRAPRWIWRTMNRPNSHMIPFLSWLILEWRGRRIRSRYMILFRLPFQSRHLSNVLDRGSENTCLSVGRRMHIFVSNLEALAVKNLHRSGEKCGVPNFDAYYTTWGV